MNDVGSAREVARVVAGKRKEACQLFGSEEPNQVELTRERCQERYYLKGGYQQQKERVHGGLRKGRRRHAYTVSILYGLPIFFHDIHNCSSTDV